MGENTCHELSDITVLYCAEKVRTTEMKNMKIDSAAKVANGVTLIDEDVPRYLALSELSLEDGFKVFNQAFSSTTARFLSAIESLKGPLAR